MRTCDVILVANHFLGLVVVGGLHDGLGLVDGGGRLETGGSLGDFVKQGGGGSGFLRHV